MPLSQIYITFTFSSSPHPPLPNLSKHLQAEEVVSWSFLNCDDVIEGSLDYCDSCSTIADETTTVAIVASYPFGSKPMSHSPLADKVPRWFQFC